MLHLTARRFATFARLLCGEDMGTRLLSMDECQEAVRAFRTLSPTAPLPVPLASALTTAHLRGEAYREAAAVLASHHRPEELTDAVVASVRANRDQYTAGNLIALTEVLRAAGAPSVVALLELLAEYSTSSAAAASLPRAEARALIQRHIRFFPSTAAQLLRPLCLASTTDRADREDVLEALQIAMRGGFVNPDDFGAVLQLFLAAQDYRRIGTLWAWMRHTSACWDRDAASAAICAAAERRHLDDAVAGIQCLAEAGHDPSVQAQEALVRFLGARDPPLPAYADQLVGLWYGDDAGGRAALWRGEAQGVAVELAFAHFRSQDHRRVMELLQEAAAAHTSDATAPATAPEQAAEAAELLQRKAVAVLMRHYAAEIAQSPELMRFFFDVPLHMTALGEAPYLAGALAVVGWRAGRLSEACDAVRGAAMTDRAFEEALKFTADGLRRGADKREDVLTILEEFGEGAGRSVPDDLRAWLSLWSAQRE